MTIIDPIFGAGMLPALKQFVMATKLHPVLVNFTAALVPVSVASDFIGHFIKSESFRHTAWWTLFYATAITPFTAITGWLFWMSDDNGVTGMTIHKWLGSGLAVLLFVLFIGGGNCVVRPVGPRRLTCWWPPFSSLPWRIKAIWVASRFLAACDRP